MHRYHLGILLGFSGKNISMGSFFIWSVYQSFSLEVALEINLSERGKLKRCFTESAKTSPRKLLFAGEGMRMIH